MKLLNTIIGVVALLAIAAPARAVTNVWFVAAPTGDGGQVQSQGGRGANLILTCEPAAPQCSWDITIAFANDPGDSPLYGWAIDLVGGFPDGLLGVVPGSVSYPNSNFPNHAAETYGVSPGYLVRYMGGFTFVPAPDSAVLATFTLRRSSGGSVGTVDHVHALTGGIEWANTDGAYPTIAAGANSPIDQGGMAGTDLGNVITINTVPEPSGGAVLICAAMFFTRHRSARPVPRPAL